MSNHDLNAGSGKNGCLDAGALLGVGAFLTGRFAGVDDCLLPDVGLVLDTKTPTPAGLSRGCGRLF
ncbi:hypothetical protein VDG1235_4395 [Verrucomicrobiia bacterium DG1235]|nr:hypothetical protein VDG1235_4395 [Verrucomicrobiae bacterium DG1235]